MISMQHFMQCHTFDHISFIKYFSLEVELVNRQYFWHLENPCLGISINYAYKFHDIIRPQIFRLSCVIIPKFVCWYTAVIVAVILAASHFQGKTVHCTTKIRGYRAGQGGQSIGGLGKIPRMQISDVVIFAEPGFIVFF